METVLVLADDERELCERAKALRSAAFTVVEARTLPAALAAAREHEPPVAVLHLDHLAFTEVCRQFRAEPRTAGTALLLISPAFVQASARVEALNSGADACLPESPSGQELVAQVRSLLRLRARLAAAVELAQLGVWEYDIASGRSYYDQRCREVFGLPAGEPLSDEEVFALVHPDDRDRVADEVRQALDPRGSGVYDTEYRIARRDGTIRTVAVRGHAIGALGRPGDGRFTGTLMDITVRRGAEAALKDSEEAARVQNELLSAIIDNIPVLLVIWDPALRSFRFNRQLRETLGWSEADAADGRFMERVYPDPEYRRSVSEYMLSLEPGWRDLKTTTKDGREIDIAWANVNLRGGASIGIGIDVRERKAFEAALESNVRILRAIMENVPEGIAICDRDARFIMSSRVALALSQRSPGDDVIAYARKNTLLAADGSTPVRPEDLPLMRALRRGEVVVGEEMVLERSDRVRIPILCNAAPMRDDEGSIVGAVLAYQDITQRKGMEDALRESDRRKDEFIAILSHELRNPLAPIRYALPLLEREEMGGDAGRAVAVIRRQVDHLTRLVDDLLDVSRITRGKIELRREDVTLASIVNASVEAAAPAIAAAGHSLSVSVTEEPVWLHADPARMAQVVMNLLNNSAKYTPRGGEIVLEARLENGRAVIRVRDNGIGIASEAIPEIFEIFRQVDLRDEHGGLGIGLALVKRLVEMHAGKIEAVSGGPGQGAEFVVTVPALPAPSLQAPPEVEAVVESVSRLRVLVVDDNQDLVDMLASVVETAGHEVRTALNGKSALSEALSYRPDVVLLDLGLPDMSGIDVASELRRREETSGIRLIALTGWGQAADREKTAEVGFDAHLTKPTEPGVLKTLLGRIAAETPP